MSAIALVVKKLICQNFMDGNNVSRLIESPFFAGARALRILKFENCPNLKPAAVAMIFANISKLPSLTELDLSRAEVDTAAFAAIANSCVPSDSLVSLHLPNFKFDAFIDGAAMVKIFSRFTALEALNLIAKSENPADLTPMFQSMSNLHQLTQLMISFQLHKCQVSYSEVASTLQKLTQLRSLEMKLSTAPNAIGFADVIEAVSLHPSLTSLTLPDLAPGATVELARGLMRNTLLKTLDLHKLFSQFDEADLIAISDLMLQNKTLTLLDLTSTCRIVEAGWEALGRMIAGNSSLRWLSINGMRLGTNLEARLPIVEALATNQSLTYLDLGGPFGAVCSTSLGQSLMKNTTLRTLKFSSELPLDFSGVFAGLATNTTLTILSISTPFFKGAIAQQLTPALSQNRGLAILELFRCSIPPQAYNEIIRSLSGNRTMSTFKLIGPIFYQESPEPDTTPLLTILPGSGPNVIHKSL
jgi:hypothetical protein